MNSRVSKDDSFEVSDSTDWLETPLRSLTAVDSALRCQVCKDFYATPMITSCSHTFCSLCIRRCLSNDAKCPACRTQDQENRLRFNGAMEELVQAFVKARPDVLDYARKPVILAETGNASPKRSREATDLDEDEGPKKRTRSSGRRKRPTQETLVLDSDIDDEDYIAEDGFVLCPICQKTVKEETINSHLDRNCVAEQTNKTRKSSIHPSASVPQKSVPRPERLAHLHYGTIKDVFLKKKLAEAGILATGTRQIMEKRYTEWITLWNANCDATKPKTKGELKRELEIWEKNQGGRAPSSNSGQNSGAQIRDKDFDGVAWSWKHNSDFQDLIEKAKRKPAVRPSTPEPTPTAEEAGLATFMAPELELTLTSPVQTAPDTEMPNIERGESPQRSDLPMRSEEPSRSKRRRLFEERPEIDKAPISSPYQSSMSIDKDPAISDVNMSRTIQP